jgi:hypothetical protein
MKISGFDKLQKELAAAQEAFADLNGNLTSIEYDPADPASIEAAIHKVDQMIDERIGRYADNPFVAPLIEKSKEHFREVIIQKAAVARLGRSDSE